MAILHHYEYDKSSAHNSPNGTWYRANLGGVNYFLKKFSWPKYPKEGISSELYSEMLSEAQNWLDQKVKIINALNEIGNGTGNIVSPREVFREKLSFYQTTYWIDSMVDSVDEISHLDENNKFMILQTFSSALSKVHSRNIVHGDLKPENIIISKNSSNNYVAKIIDFDDSYFSGHVFAPQNTIVTEAYQSPELAAYKRGHEEYHDLIKCSSDVFAAGIIFHQFWCGCFPIYEGMNEGKFLFEAVSSDEGYKLCDMPSWLNSLITMMLNADSSLRPGMDYVYDCIRNKKIIPRTSAKKCSPVPIDTVPKKSVETIPIVIPDKPILSASTSWEEVRSIIPKDLSIYTSKTLETLKRELKFATDNQTLLPADYLRKRIQKAVNGLIVKSKSDIAYIVNPSALTKFKNIEIVSDTKVKVLDNNGKTTTLPLVTALGMKLILKKS